jgi:hypothetical protein
MASDLAIVCGLTGLTVSQPFSKAVAIGEQPVACAPKTVYGVGSTRPSRPSSPKALSTLVSSEPDGHRQHDLLRQPPAELLGHLVAERLAALGVERADVDVDERPVLVLGDLAAQPVDVVVAALDGDQRLAVDGGLHDLALLEVVRDEHHRAQPAAVAWAGDGVGEVAGRGAGHGRVAERAGGRQRHRHDAVLEGVASGCRCRP